MKKAPKTEAKSISLSDEKTILFETLSFMLILCWILLTLGSLLAPVGSLLAPAGSLLAPFGSLWVHFWCPLAHFWCPFPSLLLTQGSIFSLLLYPVVIFRISWNFPWKYRAKSDSYIISFAFFKRLWLLGWSVWQRHADQKRQRERVNSNNRPNKFRKSHSRSFKSYFPEAHRTHPNRKYIFSCNPPFKGPERNLCRRQLRLIDPHRASGTLGAC